MAVIQTKVEIYVCREKDSLHTFVNILGQVARQFC